MLFIFKNNMLSSYKKDGTQPREFVRHQEDRLECAQSRVQRTARAWKRKDKSPSLAPNPSINDIVLHYRGLYSGHGQKTSLNSTDNGHFVTLWQGFSDITINITAYMFYSGSNININSYITKVLPGDITIN